MPLRSSYNKPSHNQAYPLFSLVSLTILLVVVVVLSAYIPWPARAASGSSISVPSQWHIGKINHIRIGTYNIHRGRGVDGQRKPLRVAEVIKGTDIVGLQEVGMEGLGEPQVKKLGRALDLGWLYLPTRYRWFHNDRGNGLLSVFPVNHWHCERLPQSARRTPRVLASARVLLGDKELWVLITHLNTQEGREEQLRIVLDRFRHYTPAVLLGDLNATRDDPVIQEYLGNGDAVDGLAMALGDNDPVQRVDWILVRGLEVESGGIDDNVASDHPFYWLDANLGF